MSAKLAAFVAKSAWQSEPVDGAFKMSLTNFTTAKSHSFGGKYLELTPHEKIRYDDKFDDPDLPGEMVTMVALKKVFCGTE